MANNWEQVIWRSSQTPGRFFKTDFSGEHVIWNMRLVDKSNESESTIIVL